MSLFQFGSWNLVNGGGGGGGAGKRSGSSDADRGSGDGSFDDFDVVGPRRKRSRPTAATTTTTESTVTHTIDLRLIEAVKSNEKIIKQSVKMWVERYKKNPKSATVELLMILFEACGAKYSLDEETLDETNVDDVVVALVDLARRYVVLRRDLIDTWPLGSVVTQGCHASVSAIWANKDDVHTVSYCSPNKIDSMHKVTLEVKSETQLLNLSEKLKAGNVAHKLWIEQPENVPTCLATKPYPKSAVASFFKKLKLYVTAIYEALAIVFPRGCLIYKVSCWLLRCQMSTGRILVGSKTSRGSSKRLCNIQWSTLKSLRSLECLHL
ncbi:hypothetical protein ACHQM5_020298 [Ranunculus cassubicifolius]